MEGYCEAHNLRETARLIIAMRREMSCSGLCSLFFRCTAVILEYVIALLLRLAVCINSIGFVLLLLLYLLFVIFVLRGKLEFIQFEIEIGSLVVNVSASAVFGYLLLNESIFFCSPIRIHFVVCMARYLSCGSFISLRK